MRSYEAYLERKRQEYDKKFDPSDLNSDFVEFYENQNRIEVDFGYEVKRGRVGVTTGWKPAFLLALTRRSLGSSYILDQSAKLVKIVSM